MEPSRPSRSSRASVRRSRQSRAGQGLFALALVGAPLALGAIHTTVLAIATVVAGLAALLVWKDADALRPRMAATVLVMTAAGLTLFTALQLLPLPASVLAAIAPANADVWARALSPLREGGPSFAPLTLDPVATRIEVLRGIFYLALFVTAVRLASRREGAHFCAAVLIGGSLLVGLAALLHPAMGAEKVFGLYRPLNVISPRHIGPLLNPNALGGFLNVGFCLSLAAALSGRPWLPRPIAAGSAALLAVIELWVASRGGVLAMVCGGVLVVWMLLLSRRSHRDSLRAYVPYAAVLLMAGGMWVLAGSDEAWSELAGFEGSKLTFFQHVLPMARAFPWLGAGRGAFESVFPAFRTGVGHVVFTHPENFVIQWATEWGTPVSLLTIGAIAWSMRPRVMLARDEGVAGAWAAVMTLGLQNFVDFSSEVPGVTAAAVTCAAVVCAGSSSGARGGLSRWAERPKLLGWSVLAASVLATAFAASSIDLDLYSDRARLHDLALKDGVGRDEFRVEARAAMLRHPAEPYLPFAGGLRAWRTRDESVVPWIGRVLERAPVYGPAHLVLARALYRASPAQARLEYRYAMIQAPDMQSMASTEAAALVGSFDDATELAPPGLGGVNVLEALAVALDSRLPATRLQIDSELITRLPDHVPAISRQATEVLRDLRDGDGAPWCASDPSACSRPGLERADRVIAVNPSLCLGVRLHAQIVAAAGDAQAAMNEIATAIDKLDDRAGCLLALIEIARESRAGARVSWGLDQLVKASCATDAECIEHISYAALLEVQRGNHEHALGLIRKGRTRYPDNDSLLESQGATASNLGLHAEALSAYSALAKRHPEEGRWLTAAESERAAIVRGQ